jgi:hypothetical protein
MFIVHRLTFVVKNMDIILSKERVDDQDCDLLVTGFFKDERPLKGSSGLIDWRFNGKFSRFLIEKNLSGDWNETILIPSEGRIVPRMILLLGLGRMKEYGQPRLSEVPPRLLQIVKRLEAFDICLSLPYGEGTRVDCGKMAEVLIEGIASGLSFGGDPLNNERIKKLRLYFAEGEEHLSEILAGVQNAKAVLRGRVQIGISISSQNIPQLIQTK